jgi:hypothetical protein
LKSYRKGACYQTHITILYKLVELVNSICRLIATYNTGVYRNYATPGNEPELSTILSLTSIPLITNLSDVGWMEKKKFQILDKCRIKPSAQFNRIFKIEARVVRHSGKTVFQMAEVAVPRELFQTIM